MKKIGLMLPFFAFASLPLSLFSHPSPPKLTVIIIIDQFAYHYLPKLKNNFQYGFKHLMDNGINYINAYHPHGIPETTPGHNAFNTGVLPNVHGAISNKWIRKNDSTHVRYEFDNNLKTSVVYKDEKTTGNYGLSPINTKVEGFSDQFMLASTPQKPHMVFSLGIKATSTIATANKLGKAIWFDDTTGRFTSSKKYFSTFPKWVSRFNRKNNVEKLTSTSWETFYSRKDPAYNFPFIDDYENAVYPFTMAGNKKIPINRSEKHPFDLFIRTPAAAKHLFELGKSCLTYNLAKKNDDKMVLWLCVSCLDLVGHMYGPDSREVIDLLYHLDKQLLDFMQFTRRRYGEQNVLFMISGDHGIQPIQEIMRKKGITTARRISAKKLLDRMNNFVAKKYNINKLITAFSSTYFSFDHKKFDTLPYDEQEDISQDLKNLLQQEPGIKKVWTRKELETAHYAFHELEHFYKNHLHHNRIMDLICMPEPYCLVTNYTTGCSHNTPYDYDTHVPLILYRKNHLEHKTVTQKVWIPQAAVTLAQLHNIVKPAAATFNELPNIFKE